MISGSDFGVVLSEFFLVELELFFQGLCSFLASRPAISFSIVESPPELARVEQSRECAAMLLSTD